VQSVGELGCRATAARAVDDDLVGRIQLTGRFGRVGHVERAWDVLGPEGPLSQHHDELEGVAPLDLVSHLVFFDEVHFATRFF
jgi:hypothetical protein